MEVMKVEKFNGNNFQQWKFTMKCALRAKGLNIYTTKPSEAAAAAQWNKDDGMAMYILTSSMELNQIALVENCETAVEVLSKLEAIYERKSELNKMFTHEKFYQYKYCESDTMAQHVAKVEGLAKELRESGEKLSETAVITKIISTLPSEYRSLRQAWLSLDPDQQTIHNLTSRLIDEEASLANYLPTCSETALVSTKRNSKTNNQDDKNKLNFQKSSNHRFVCYNCNKRGHFARDCRKPKKIFNKNIMTHDMSAFGAEKFSLSVNSEEAWILDSGASMHMTFRRDYFCELTEHQGNDINEEVKLGNKQSLKVCGKGNILIDKVVYGKWERCILENVLYVPDLRRNLFSEGAATRKGYVIVKNCEKAMIMKNNRVVMCAHSKGNNLYELEIKTVVQENCNIVQTDVKVWHERMGHLNIKEVQNMSKCGVIPVTLTGNADFICEACQYGKQARFPFMKSNRGPTNPGQIVYSDVCGLIEAPSVAGMKYFVLFKDGATSFRHVYFMKHKNEVFQYFVKYNALVNNQFHHDVHILHTDNGKEYVNNEFKNFLESKGITHECTAPYTPQQNGRAEREMRTIMESARSMLYAKDISLNLWAEAVNCAVYLLNRNTSSQTGSVTPFELWHGIKPDLQHIRVFGTVGYVHESNEKRKKLDTRSSKMMLVGYENNNYRMYDQCTRKVTLSRDVKFEEYFRPEEKEKITEIILNEEQKEQSMVFPQSDGQNQYNISEEISSDDSIKSFEDADDTYNPPRGIIVEARERNFTLRPRRNKRMEVNLAEVYIPNNYEEAVNSANSYHWKKAIDEDTIKSKLVFTLKKNRDNKTFPPTNRYNAKEDLQIERFEVPVGVKDEPSTQACMLIKSIKPCPSDNCVFVCYFNDFKMFLIIYVDDGLTSCVLSNILRDRLFDIKILKFNTCIGIEINKTNGCISTSQRQYMKTLIKKLNLLDAKCNSTPVDVNVQLSKGTSIVSINFQYREAVGALLFLKCVSRPDIGYAVNIVSRYVYDPGPSLAMI